MRGAIKLYDLIHFGIGFHTQNIATYVTSERNFHNTIVIIFNLSEKF